MGRAGGTGTGGAGEGDTGAGGTPAPLGQVLIVEDDALLALDMAEALAAAGAEQVTVCPSVAAALGELERIRPVVLVLDVHLADRDDGWTLAELVTALHADPPLLVFSTGAPQSIPPAVAEMGHVLTKPFRSEDLVRLVHAHARRPGLLGRLRRVLPL